MKKILTAAILLIVAALVVLRLHGRDGRETLSWHEAGSYRWADLHVPHGDRVGFERLSASRTGVDFTNRVSEEEYTRNTHYLNGSGVALGDVDGDGLTDIYLARLHGPNALYRNLGGWKFEDIAAEAGVAVPDRFSTGVVFADVDGDGDADLLVNALGGPNALFLNDGTGHFREATREAGLSSHLGSMSMALADVDGDGDLDLYVANNKVATVRDLFSPEERATNRVLVKVDGRYEIAPRFREHYVVGNSNGDFVAVEEVAEPDRFYLNDGSGRFTPVPFTSASFRGPDGARLEEEPREWTLSVRFQDMDGDGDPDLYVADDFQSPDHIWINDGAGHFRALPLTALRHTSEASMGVDFADIDRDGDEDLLVVEMRNREHSLRMREGGGGRPEALAAGEPGQRPQVARNTLQLNRGDGTYADIAYYAGLEASGWSWFGIFLDVDLDGYEDLLVGNGHFYDAMDRDAALRASRSSSDWRSWITLYPPLRQRNLLFRNRGDLTFREVGQAWGFSDEADISHGVATGDLDNDGDLDVVINRLFSPVSVLRNRTSEPRIAVRLRGRPPNTEGIGATVRVLGGPVPQSKEVVAGGTYLSGSDPTLMFAAGRAGGPLRIEVRWRDGVRSTVEEARPDRVYEIREPAAASGGDRTSEPRREAAAARAYFEDASVRLDHVHHDDPFDDFQRQPLLPNRLSGLGPGVAWVDVDGDGWEDLLIGSGRGGELASYHNDGGGDFSRIRDPILSKRSQLDQTTILGWRPSVGGTRILVGMASYEAKDPLAPGTVAVYELRPDGRARSLPGLPGFESSTGPLALADYDGDGALDLFVGGRVIPGRYPVAPSSRLYLGAREGFRLDTANSAVLAGVGLVSGAVFSDLDGDGDPDLALASEWGPIHILENRGGRFWDATERLGLAPFTGRWNGITTGDLDEDGRLDILATNWGLNTGYRASREHPALLFHADFDRNGTWDVLEARYDSAMDALVPIRGLLDLAAGLPYLRTRIHSYAEYGSMRLDQIIGPRLTSGERLEAATLATTAFLNRGERFQAVPLPAEAQFAPAFAAEVADLDGDGHEDVFLSQNFFATRSRDRADAGRALWLRGDGAGGLSPVPGQVSGIRAYGEQRGSAVADFDGDGRADLAIAQNQGATRLYRNVGAAPGIRVRLEGPAGNPWAIGAAIRLLYENGAGPVRELHAGAGYWSQDGRVQVLGRGGRTRAVWVRWPGGEVTETGLGPGAREITISAPGVGPPGRAAGRPTARSSGTPGPEAGS
ncbi:MAG: VCBS repeat-containing protein [Gemmatimonadota bacterium]